MRIEEAKWIGAKLGRMSALEIGPLLDFGCSDVNSLIKTKPHIEEFVYKPLKSKGVRVIHFDLRDGPGVHISGDIYDEITACKIRDEGVKSILCANVLEHVDNPKEIISALVGALPEMGHLFITVPNSFPYHPDPIDTGFRPSPDDLVNYLPPDMRVVLAENVISTSYLQDLLSHPLREFRKLGGIVKPFASRERRHSSFDRLRWLFKRYKVTCLIAQKCV